MNSLANKENWSGIWTAIITPFDNHSNLDLKSLKNLIDQQITNGVTGLVIAGSTGEGSLLNKEEYTELLKQAYKINNKRVHLIAGLGIGGTESCLENLKIAKDLGYNAVLASPPAYIKTPPKGLFEHYKELAKHNIPICLYEVPNRSASSLTEEVIDQLLDDPACSNIIAIKDASADIKRQANRAQKHKNRLAMLSGDDESFVAFLGAGGEGIISVATHFLSKEYIQMKELCKNGNNPEAENIIKELGPFIASLYWESNPIPVKSLCAHFNLIAHDQFKSPLYPMTTELKEKSLSLFEKIKSL